MRKVTLQKTGLIIILLFAFSIAGYANPGGKTGTTLKSGGLGCYCHTAAASPSVVSGFTGPLKLSPGQTAVYNLTISGGPGTGSGCDIAADSGALGALSSYLKLSGDELVQTATVGFQNGSAVYRFTFKAPLTPGSVKLYGTALSSNRTESSGLWSLTPTATITIATPTAAPTVPVLSYPSTNATNQLKAIRLGWNSTAITETYRVQVSTDPNFGTTLVDSLVIDTVLQVQNLGNITKYYWRVKSKNVVGESAWPTSWNFTTLSIPDYTAGAFAIIGVQTDDPDIVTIVALEDLKEGATFTFTDNAWVSATGFAVNEGYFEWTVSPSIPAGTPVTFNGGTTWSATTGIVSSAGTYPSLSTSGDQVTAFRGTWDGRPTSGDDTKFIWAFSTENFASAGSTTTSDCPTALTNFSTALTTSTTEKDNGYFANGITPVSSVAITDSKANMINLFKDGINKYYKDDAIASFPTYIITIGTISGPPPVPVLAIPAAGATSQPKYNLRLAWNKASGADRYWLQVSTVNTFATTIFSDSTLADTSIVLKNTGLANGTKYFWRAKAINALGASAWPTPFDFTTIAGAPLTGTKTVGGTGANYPSLKEALRDLTNQGTASPGITFALRNGSYFEDTLIVQTYSTSASAPVKITVEQGASVTINDSASAALPFVIKIDNTPYVTIDGGTNRSLLINGIGANVQKGILVSGGSQYATIKNCVVRAGAYSTSSYSSVELSSPTPLSSPHFSVVDNNVIRNSYYGIRLTGNSATDSLVGIIVSNNLVDSVSQDGVYTTYTAYAQIFGNDISVLIGGAATMYGIYAGSATDNMRIYNNKIHDLNQQSTSSSVTYGIGTNTGSAAHGGISMFNNFVNISPTNAGSGGIYGLYSSEVNSLVPDTVAFNTVNITGTSAAVRNSNAYYRGSSVGVAGVIVKNNILQNTRNDAAGSNVCAIGRTGVASKIISDNNNLYVGTLDATHKIGRIGTSLIYSTLNDWAVGDTSDAASISENSPFITTTNLHIVNGSNTKLAGGAVPLPGFPKDIDGDIRSLTKPDIGADEFSTPIIPVELSSFSAQTGKKVVYLNWVTSSEKNNYGFEVERKLNGNWEKVDFAKGKGTTLEITKYSITDSYEKINFNGKASYRLKQIDYDGSYTYSNTVTVNVNFSPSVFSLDQNYPNPFNPSTVINYALQTDSRVKIVVYNTIGQVVKELVNSVQSAGSHDVKFDAGNLSSGIYFYSIEASPVDGSAKFNSVRKATLLK